MCWVSDMMAATTARSIPATQQFSAYDDREWSVMSYIDWTKAHDAKYARAIRSPARIGAMPMAKPANPANR